MFAYITDTMAQQPAAAPENRRSLASGSMLLPRSTWFHATWAVTQHCMLRSTCQHSKCHAHETMLLALIMSNSQSSHTCVLHDAQTPCCHKFIPLFTSMPSSWSKAANMAQSAAAYGGQSLYPLFQPGMQLSRADATPRLPRAEERMPLLRTRSPRHTVAQDAGYINRSRTFIHSFTRTLAKQHRILQACSHGIFSASGLANALYVLCAISGCRHA